MIGWIGTIGFLALPVGLVVWLVRKGGGPIRITRIMAAWIAPAVTVAGLAWIVHNLWSDPDRGQRRREHRS